MLVSVATELAVFRLGEPVLPRAAGATFSLGPEFLDSQEKGLVIFRAGGGGGGGTVVLEVGGTGLGFGGDSAFDGDHGIEGREDAMLLRESFFVGCFCAAGTGWSSTPRLADEFHTGAVLRR